jgi:hypothetical protein
MGTQPHIVAPRWEHDVGYDEHDFFTTIDRQQRRVREWFCVSMSRRLIRGGVDARRWDGAVEWGWKVRRGDCYSQVSVAAILDPLPPSSIVRPY